MVAHVGKKLNVCPNRKTVCSINTELMAFSASEKFPDMKATKEDLQVLSTVLDPEAADIHTLIAIMERLQHLRATQKPLGPLLKFLIDGGIGLKFWNGISSKHRRRSVGDQRICNTNQILDCNIIFHYP